MYTIGIDLGTSSTKFLLVRDDGTIVNEVSKEYPLYFPKETWSEQNPSDWWNALKVAIPELIKGVDNSEIVGIGIAGQMHGLVILDDANEVIRPAILWNDGRTAKEVDYLNNVIGKDILSEYTGNIAFAGFTAPKILWLKANEKENFDKIQKIMLPKDYLVYMLTGVHATDYSDASGMLLLDVKNKCWSEPMCDICGISVSKLPRLYESFEVVGSLKEDIAKELGLLGNTKVVAGAGDNAAAAIGTKTIGNGRCNISLGTSGTVFISSDNFGVDKTNGLHAFAHADGAWHLMGCMLSAASCNKWFMEDILQDKDYRSIQENIGEDRLGRNTTYFLPYLMGERSPINDVDARGMFIGMTMDTGREDMLLSVLEGVAFAIRDQVEVAKSIGVDIRFSTLCGGGSKSKLWRRVLANILNVPLNIPMTMEGPGYGGAVLAMVGLGLYDSLETACDTLIHIDEVIMPEEKLVAYYEERYEKFSHIYKETKNLFQILK